MATPEIGAYYALAKDAALGVGEGSLAPGAVVKVVRIAAPGEPGVGHSGHETVIAEHVYDVAGVRDGTAVRVSHVRYVSLPAPDFDAKFASASAPEAGG